MELLELAEQKVVVMDGATGSAIQNLGLPEDAFAGKPGCNEYLVFTAPDAFNEVHCSYLEAGA